MSNIKFATDNRRLSYSAPHFMKLDCVEKRRFQTDISNLKMPVWSPLRTLTYRQTPFLVVVSYMTNDYIINVHYKLEFSIFRMYCFIASTKSCITCGDAWSDDLLTYKKLASRIRERH